MELAKALMELLKSSHGPHFLRLVCRLLPEVFCLGCVVATGAIGNDE
jgi:hypothetical protein